MPERLLLCTDLDRTLIPNGAEPEFPGARRHFSLLAQHPSVTLVHISGRHRALVQSAIAEYDLPQPQFVIGDVGTTIYRVDAGADWTPLHQWENQLAAEWPRQTPLKLQHALEDLPALCLQEQEKQSRYKLSYYVSLSAARDELDHAVNCRFENCGEHARLVWSIDEASNVGLLDVLPVSASKYFALKALQSQEGFSDADTVFSGDSGNDMDILVSSVPAVLVANSASPLQLDAVRAAAAAGYSERLYIARGGFMGMNGNYSAGILEGVAHYHPEAAGWMGFPDRS